MDDDREGIGYLFFGVRIKATTLQQLLRMGPEVKDGQPTVSDAFEAFARQHGLEGKVGALKSHDTDAELYFNSAPGGDDVYLVPFPAAVCVCNQGTVVK